MMDWWDRLLRIFSTFWVRDSREAMRRGEMRKIRLALKGLHPPVYRPSSSQLLPGFAERVLALRQHLAPVAALLEKTLRHSDPRLAERFRDELVELHLHDELLSRLELLREEPLRERLATSSAPAAEMKKLDGEMVELLRACSDCAPAVDEALTDLDFLADLCRYDFVQLLQGFDPRFPAEPEASPETRHRFQPVDGRQVLGELEDLYFVLASTRIPEEMERELVVLLIRLQRERAAESREPLLQALVRLRGFIEHALNPTLVLNLIRALQGDPFLQLEFPRERRPALQPYLDRFVRRYRQIGERILREEREKELELEVQRLFEGAELLEVAGYGEDTARALADAGLASYRQVRPLRLLRSFACAHFGREIRDAVLKLLQEGGVEDRALHQTLNDSFYGCEGVREKIETFEDGLRSADPVSAQALREQMERHAQGKPAAAAVNRIVEAIDEQARRIVEEGAAAFFHLGSLLYGLLNDAKASGSERVKNIRTIGGAHNREFLAGLAQGYAAIRSFVQIMGHFTPLPSEGRPAGERGADGEPAADGPAAAASQSGER